MPLSDETKNQIRSALAAIREAVPGFRDRPSQRRMIAEVAKTLSGEYGDSHIIACEAGTGTGKSLAYLLAAIPVAQARRKHVVISTATVALQEQLLLRDLPALIQNSGLKFDFALAKGRRRYVCNLNLSRLSGEEATQQTLFEDVAAWTRAPQPAELATVKRMRASQQKNEWDGDLDAWPESLAPDFVEMITTDRHGCLANACPHIRHCAFFRARDSLRDSTVIVANHDLVLADLSMGGGAILPPTEDTLFVFDEAHHLATKAVRHFSAQTRLRGARDWLKRLPKLVEELRQILPDDPRQARLAAEAADLAGRCMGLLEQAHEDLLALFPDMESGAIWRFPNGVAPEPVLALAQGLESPAKTLADHISQLRKQLIKALEDGYVPASRCEGLLPDIGFLSARLESFHSLWRMMASKDPAEAPPTARWIELTGQPGRADMDFLMAASMVAPGGMLRKTLWDVCAGAVLTSATLTALGRFDRLRMNTGLRDDDGTQYLRLESPFDYAARAELYLPWMDSDPRNPEQHTNEVAAMLERLIDQREGTLVLFASAWQLEAVYERLPTSLQDFILRQGNLPKAVILERHRQRIEQGEGSAIFGLASFTEGVDLPGALCRHVIVTKIPFAVPDSPVDATLSDWLESRGRNPFLEITVPDASLKLVQACGRLIRSEEDTGRVTLLDRRLLTRSYGRQLLDALPPFRRRIERYPPQRHNRAGVRA